MRVAQRGPVTQVILSRRNLLALLAKLDGYPPDSFCSIAGGSEAEGYMVTAEEDHIHYQDRPAGQMIGPTEERTTRPPTGTEWGHPLVTLVESIEQRIERMMSMANPDGPKPETPAEFVARLGIGLDKAWRLWNQEESRAMSRTAFREAARES